MSECNCGNSSIGRWTGRVGGQIGDKIDAFGQRQLKRFKAWSGLGDYNLYSNSLINAGSGGSSTPQYYTDGRSLIIRYKEYLGDVAVHPTDVGAFNSTSYNINPANELTFPWVGKIASQYDQWKPRGVIFEFLSTATDSSTVPNLGSVIMATEYDVLDSVYSDKRSMLNSAYSNEAKMSDNIAHGLECDPNELQRKVFYTRSVSKNLGTSEDLRDYDMCRTTIATQGGSIPAGTIIGSLYVHYEFELFKEQMYLGIPAKDRIYSYMQKESTSNVGTWVWRNWFEGDGTGIIGDDYKPPIVGGVDLGIVFDQDVIKIPKKWAGYTFRCTVWNSGINAVITANTLWTASTTNCSFQPSSAPVDPTKHLLFPTNAQFLAPSNILTARENLMIFGVKLDNVIGDEFATITNTGGTDFAPFPQNVNNTTRTFQMYWEHVPNEAGF